MTARIVYEGLQKTFRYERNQHGDIDESEDPFKCDETPFKDNSEKRQRFRRERRSKRWDQSEIKRSLFKRIVSYE